jgi:hypothetical protein
MKPLSIGFKAAKIGEEKCVLGESHRRTGTPLYIA